jgi:hypothetical protein
MSIHVACIIGTLYHLQSLKPVLQREVTKPAAEVLWSSREGEKR